MSETKDEETYKPPSTFAEVAAQQPEVLVHDSQHVDPATGRNFVVRYVREDLCTLKAPKA